MRCLLKFLRDDTGAVTIEFVTLVPAFVMLLVFFTDVSIVYLTHTEMWNTARDISRRMSTDEITTPDQVEDYAVSHLFLAERQYLVVPDFGAEMDVSISVGMSDAAIFGFWLKPLLGNTLTVSARMRREPLD